MNDSIIIIPAYNEENNIGRVLQEIKSYKLSSDILVVNDGSVDKTEMVADREQVTVIRHPFNLGYGAALQTGFKYAVQKGYKYVVQFDADGQHDPADIGKILEELRKNHVHIVIGSRFLGQGTLKTGLSKKIVIAIFTFLIRILTGTRVTDPTSGFKGLGRPLFSYYSVMGKYPEDFPDADILIQTIKCRYNVSEIPVNMHNRLSGKGMHDGFSLKHLYYLCKIILSILIILLRVKTSAKECDTYGESC